MPIYAYKCTECGHPVEVLQKVSDPPLVECPNCRRPALAKQVTAAGFQLKGSGWYVTDFRDKAAPKKETPKSDGSSPAGDGAESSKPAPAATPAPAGDGPASPAPAAPPPASSTGSS
jgi:putative FmdB family regulatory protein